MKKIKRLCTLFMLSCLYIGSAQPTLDTTGYRIGKVEVDGNLFLDTDLLITLSGLQEGAIIDPYVAGIHRSIRKIAKQDGIKSVSIYLSKVDEVNKLANFVIRIEEHPQLVHFLVEGLTKKEQKELLENVPVDNNVALSPLFLQKTVAKIKKFFLEKGFREVQLFTELVPSEAMDQKVTLKIKIDKGTKSRVHRIILEGNHHLDSDLLRYNIKDLKEAPHFTLVEDIFKKAITLRPIRKGGLLLQLPKTIDAIKCYLSTHVSFSSSVFTEDKYIKAKESLILFYQSQGFRDVHIAAERLEPYTAGKLNIYFKINEGNQYTIRHIKWVGNYVYSDQVLNQCLNLQEGRVYDPVYINSQLISGIQAPTIRDLYANNGYFNFRAEVIETRLEGNQVDLEIRIQEGKQFTIGQVDITGNTLTHDYVIRRELLTLPGEKYNEAIVRASIRNLAMLKLFKHEKLNLDIQPNETKNTVDLIYLVKEDPKFDIKLNLSGGNGIVAGLEFGSNNISLKNLFKGKTPVGGAQELHLIAQMNGKDYKNFTFSFQEPWLWLRSHPYIFSISFNSAFQNALYESNKPLDDWVNLTIFPFGKQDKEATIQSIGGRVGLGKKFAKYWEIHGAIDYHYHKYAYYPVLPDQIKRSGPLHDFRLELAWQYSSINHPNYPTSGAAWSNFLTLTPPYTLFGYSPALPSDLPSCKEFGKFIMDLTYFKHLFGNCVLHFRGHLGLLHSLSGKKIGPFERFYLGGISTNTSTKLLGTNFISLRGYPDESLTPEDYKDKIKGGVVFNKFVSELRYAVALAPICCYVLGFVEIGDSWLNYKDVNGYNMKKSIGSGIRLILPIPFIPMLGLDFSYRLDPVNDIRNANKSFGYRFIFWPITR